MKNNKKEDGEKMEGKIKGEIDRLRDLLFDCIGNSWDRYTDGKRALAYEELYDGALAICQGLRKLTKPGV